MGALLANTDKNIILVPCAIIEREGLVLAAQRSSSMSLPLKWEFPGGKVDEGETEIEALHREIMEELSVEIEVYQRLEPTYKDDPLKNRIICLIPYLCKLLSQPIILTEHAQYQWVSLEKIKSLDWAPADLEVIDTYLSHRKPLLQRRSLSRMAC
jgi:8-oxo-dGTP diphosphatase